MLEQLRCLIEFQILEDRKARLIRSCQETPKRIAELEREFLAYEGEYLAKKAEYEQAKKMHRSLEQTIADLESRIARSKNRSGEVKTNKEYHAILKEIEELKKEIKAKEDSALEVMESIERLATEVESLQQTVEGRRKVFEEDKGKLEAENAQLKERLDHLESLQQKVRDKLEPSLLKRSEFLVQKQAGIAVAAVENGVCQVCHLNIPPQKFIELQRDENIMQCPHCHRFIYWPGHQSYCLSETDLDGGELLSS